MRSITIHFGEAERQRKRRQRRGAAVGLIVLGAVGFATLAGRPAPVVLKPDSTATIVTTTRTVSTTTTQATATTDITATTDTTATTVTVPPPVAATLAAQPRRLVFTQRKDGGVPAAQFIHVANTGDEPLGLGRPATRSTSFRVTADCPPKLAKHEACVVAALFDPTVAGNASDTLTIKSGGGTALIDLIGTATPPPAIELQPVDFGRQLLGVTGEAHGIRLTNSRGMPLAIGAVTVPLPFHLITDRCSGTRLLSGAACDLLVDFDPAAAATYDVELLITAADRSLAARAALHGIGISALVIKLPPVKLIIEPRRIDFAGPVPRSKPIMVRNPGPRPANITDVVLSPSAGEFEIKTNCRGTLVPNAECRIDIYLTAFNFKGGAANVIVKYDGTEDSAGVMAHQKE
jgi:hypothetical protein